MLRNDASSGSDLARFEIYSWEVADIVRVLEDWEDWAVRKWLSIVCQVAAAVLLLAVVAWRFDPALQSNLIEG
jgi:hypothetical protein